MTESAWEAYFKERSALDYRYEKETFKEDAEADEANEAGKAGEVGKAISWPHKDFPAPQLPSICRESYSEEPIEELEDLQKKIATHLAHVVSGCSRLPNKAQLQKTISSSFYILKYWYAKCCSCR